MHPSAALTLWLVVSVAAQFLDYPGLAAITLFLLAMPAVLPFWLASVRRARWLLATLWAILAWNVPGEAVGDIAWGPTYEGVAEATRHALRLVAMLGLLAALLSRFGRDGLVSGLWGLLRPLRQLGIDSERLVVRLALVLEEGLRNEPGGWQKVLRSQPPSACDGVMRVALPAWRAGDSAVVLVLFAVALASAVLR